MHNTGFYPAQYPYASVRPMAAPPAAAAAAPAAGKPGALRLSATAPLPGALPVVTPGGMRTGGAGAGFHGPATPTHPVHAAHQVHSGHSSSAVGAGGAMSARGGAYPAAATTSTAPVAPSTVAPSSAPLSAVTPAAAAGASAAGHAGDADQLVAFIKLLLQRGMLADAKERLTTAVAQHPSAAAFHELLAQVAKVEQRQSDVVRHYAAALQLDESVVSYYISMGNAHQRMGQAAEAMTCYQTAVARANATPAELGIAYSNLGSVSCSMLSDLEKGEMFYRKALSFNPKHIDAYLGLGEVLTRQKKFTDAVTCYRNASQVDPRNVRCVVLLGNAFKAASQVQDAAACFQRALALQPGSAFTHHELACFLRETGRHQEAFVHACQATALDPSMGVAYSTLGLVLNQLGRLPEAIQNLEKGCQLQPASSEAFRMLGNAYKDSNKYEQAIAAYRRTLEIDPSVDHAFCLMLHTLQLIADWDDREANFVKLRHLLSDEYEADHPGSKLHVLPFHAIGYPFSAAEMLSLCRAHAKKLEASVKPMQFKMPGLKPGERLRIGYVSSDFCRHPLSDLTQSIYGFHDRSKFEIFCYATSADDGSAHRKKISSEAEHFVELTTLSNEDAAKRINRDRIHILFDLNGFTKGMRTEIFAMRPAAINAAYMGFPCTSGLDCIDYFIADKVAVPHDNSRFFSEHIVRMPNSYFVNDHANSFRHILDPSKHPTRVSVGLPEDKFVFCCFNQLYKFDPETLSCWCRILQRVSNSVLWLLKFPAEAQPNITKQVVARGISADRLIFTPTMGKDIYMANATLANLFLDTPECNGHTTGTDVLWAGVPLVTLPKDKLASRVAASLVTAVGCPEMIVDSYKEYEDLAVELATNMEAYAALCAKLHTNRLTKPLFNTRLWVRELELALVMMWNAYAAGGREALHDIDVPQIA